MTPGKRPLPGREFPLGLDLPKVKVRSLGDVTWTRVVHGPVAVRRSMPTGLSCLT